MIEIHQPEIETIIQQRLQSGAFSDVEDVILHALKSSEPAAPAVPSVPENRQDSAGLSSAERRKPEGRKRLPELFESIRGLLSDEEVDTLFARNRSPSRPVDLE